MEAANEAEPLARAATRRPLPGRFVRGPWAAGAGACAAAGLCVALLATCLGVTANAAVARSSAAHGGSLTAVGLGPYDYVNATTGDEYGAVATSGTLTGFKPGVTYYVYDLDGSAPGTTYYTSVAVKADAAGDLVLRHRNLHLYGNEQDCATCFMYSGSSRHPEDTTSLRYYVSTDANATVNPPDKIVYTPPTIFLPNRWSDPWTAQGGTWLDSESSMGNIGAGGAEYEFMATPNDSGAYCLYDGATATWCTPTAGALNVLWMQRDGNLVVYGKDGRALWQSGTSGNPGAHLVLQYDRNLVIYSATGKALWSTNTERG